MPGDRDELQRFRAALVAQLGWAFEDERAEMLAGVLQRRVESTRERPDTYLHRLERGGWPAEQRALALELTIGETFFFRNYDQFRAFREVVIPERAPLRPGGLRLLSAACSSGDEAYSLAITVREVLGAQAGLTQILGVDINPDVLERARRAEYSTWALREVPEQHKRWFIPKGKGFTLPPEILQAVRFEEKNLLAPDAELWADHTWDAVFCRNMLMYLAPEQTRTIVGRIARALVPGGYLFVGHAETMRGVSDEFELCHSHRTFYYRRIDRRRRSKPRPELERIEPPAPRPSAPPPEVPFSTTNWIDQVQLSSERIRQLSERADTTDSPWASIRSAEALAPNELDAGEKLIRAVAATDAGQWDAAETVCEVLLRDGDLPQRVGAHYLTGLCREARGDVAGARRNHDAAVTLDPTFAMSRLHLGLLARRAGDAERARRELTRAMLMLAEEDAARLTLFGGGFTREALVALCRGELAASQNGAHQ